MLILGSTNAYKVLVAFPYPGKSHSILGEGFVKRLLKAGHEVGIFFLGYCLFDKKLLYVNKVFKGY